MNSTVDVCLLIIIICRIIALIGILVRVRSHQFRYRLLIFAISRVALLATNPWPSDW